MSPRALFMRSVRHMHTGVWGKEQKEFSQPSIQFNSIHFLFLSHLGSEMTDCPVSKQRSGNLFHDSLPLHMGRTGIHPALLYSQL